MANRGKFYTYSFNIKPYDVTVSVDIAFQQFPRVTLDFYPDGFKAFRDELASKNLRLEKITRVPYVEAEQIE